MIASFPTRPVLLLLCLTAASVAPAHAATPDIEKAAAEAKRALAFQVKEHLRKRTEPMGAEFERICQLGSLTPDAWMRKAVGAPLSSEPLLQAAASAYAEAARP